MRRNTAHRTGSRDERFVFAFDCVSSRGAIINDMKSRAVPVARRTFLLRVVADEFLDRAAFYRGETNIYIGPQDWHVRYFRSTLADDTPVYFFSHSGIEFVFVPPGYYVDDDALETLALAREDEPRGNPRSTKQQQAARLAAYCEVHPDRVLHLYHGTDRAGAERIVREGVLRGGRDGFPPGVCATAGAARLFALMKGGHEGAVVLGLDVPCAVVNRLGIIAEVGGSSRNEFLLAAHGYEREDVPVRVRSIWMTDDDMPEGA